MPEIVSCPDCGRKLRVPDDLLGRNVKCPGCSKKFRAEGPTAFGVAPHYDTAPRDDYDDDRQPPRRRRRDDDYDDDYDYPDRRRDFAEPSKGEVRDGWRKVRLGVNLVIIAIWVAIGGFAVVMVSALLLTLFGAFSFASIFSNFSGGGPASQQQVSDAANQAIGTGCALWVGLILVWGVGALCMLAYAALRITGLGFCMGIAPTRKASGLKGLAIASFCLAIAGLVFPMTFLGAGFVLAQSNVGGCLAFTGYPVLGLVGLGEFICFMLFLRGVAQTLRRYALAQNLLMYMIVVPIFGAAVLAAMFILPMIGAALFLGTVRSGATASPDAAVNNAAGAAGALMVGGIVCSGLFVLLSLGLLVWYVLLLHQVRGAIDDRLARGSA